MQKSFSDQAQTDLSGHARVAHPARSCETGRVHAKELEALEEDSPSYEKHRAKVFRQHPIDGREK